MIVIIISVILAIIFICVLLSKSISALERFHERRGAVQVHTRILPRSRMETYNRISGESSAAHSQIDSSYRRLIRPKARQHERTERRILKRAGTGQPTTRLVGKRLALSNTIQALHQAAERAHDAYDSTAHTWRFDKKTGELKGGIRHPQDRRPLLGHKPEDGKKKK